MSYPGVQFAADDVLAALRKQLAEDIDERTRRGDGTGCLVATAVLSNVIQELEYAAHRVQRGLPFDPPPDDGGRP